MSCQVAGIDARAPRPLLAKYAWSPEQAVSEAFPPGSQCGRRPFRRTDLDVNSDIPIQIGDAKALITRTLVSVVGGGGSKSAP